MRADLHTKPQSCRRAPSPASRARALEAASVELNSELRGAAAAIERIRTPPKRPSPQGSVTSEASRQKKTRKPPLPRRRGRSHRRRPREPGPAAGEPGARRARARTTARGARAAATRPDVGPQRLGGGYSGRPDHAEPALRAGVSESVVDQYVGISREGGNASALLYLLPLVLLIVYDAAHNPLHRFFPFPDRWANYVLRVAGGYGIVQVLAQDLGLKTGAVQRDLVQRRGSSFCSSGAARSP